MTVFSGTGLDLYNDPATTFPNGLPTVTGTSIDFAPSATDQILAVYPLLDPGILANDVRITIDVNMTRLTADFDPLFAVSDGADVLGGQVGDNPGGSARAVEATVSGNLITRAANPAIFSNAGFVGVGSSLDARIEITVRNTRTVRVAFMSGDGTVATTPLLDPAQGLSFMLIANSYFTDVPEQYRINTLTLAVEQVPEPRAMLPITLLALTLLSCRPLRRTA